MTVRDSGSLFLEVASRPAALGVGIEFDVYDGGSLGSMLATFEGATKGSFQNVLSDTGAGSFELNKHDAKYSYVVRDNLIKVRVDGVYEHAFFVEEINPVEASPNGEGAEMVKVGGRGALAYLERAVIYPSDWATGGSTPKVSYTGVTKAAILIDQLTKAQARGAILGASWDFTATTDSRGMPWSDTNTLDFHIGTDLLSFVKSLSALGDFDVDMTPGLKLRAFNSQGADIASTVVFREGKHLGEADLQRQLHARTTKTRMLVEGSGSWVDSHGKTQYALEVADTADESNPLIGRRESYLQYGKSSDIATLEGAGNATIQQLRAQGESLQLPVTHGPSADALGNATGDYQPFVDYVKGDTPALDVPGTFDRAPYRIVGITVSQRDGDDYDVTLDFNSLYLEHLLRLAQQVNGLSGGTGAGVSSSQIGGVTSLGGGPPGGSSDFGKVAVASDDSADFLDNKLVAATGGGVSVVRIGSGGTQQLEIVGSVVTVGTLAGRPAASAANAQTFYFATDVAGGTLYVSTGSAWDTCSAGANPTITETNLSLSDVTTDNVSTSKHGFVPKLPGDATKFLDGTGAFTAPGGGGGGGTVATGPFTTVINIDGLAGSPDIKAGGTNDEEFDQNSAGVPAGWTQFNAGTGAVVDTTTAKSFLHYKSGSAQGGADRVEGIYKAAPTIPYTMTACLAAVTPYGQFFRAGIAVMDATTSNKLIGASWLTGVGPAENSFSNWTTDASFSQTALIGNPGLFPKPFYLRIVVHSATNVDVLYSLDGRLWTTQLAAINFLASAGFVAVYCSPYNQQGELLVDWIRFT